MLQREKGMWKQSLKRISVMAMAAALLSGTLPADMLGGAAGQVEAEEVGFVQNEWKGIVFGQSTAGADKPTLSEDGSTITVEMKQGQGKVTDAAQDGIAYYYTEIDPKYNFELTADLKVEYFITKSAPDAQEGFGIMVRDTIGTDGDSSISYSNALGVGGYYGKYNFFGRYGYSEATADTFTNVVKYGKAGDLTYQIKSSAPKTFRMTMKKDNTGVWVSMVDLSDNSNCLKSSGSKEIVTENGLDMVYLPADTFTTLQTDKYYVGFMAARGAKFTVDTSTIKFSKTEAATDAPRREKPQDPITPAANITSLSQWSIPAYTLKVYVNAAGTLTVTHNGTTIAKQQEIAGPGEYTFDLTLTEGGNSVKLSFDAKETDEIKFVEGASTSVNKSTTITMKQYETLFVSPTGKSSGKGTQESPLDVKTAIAYSQPGQTVYLLDGTYTFTSNIEIPHGNAGTESESKNFFAYNGTDNVIFNFSGRSAGFRVSGDYWHVKGIQVTNGTGLRVGGNHNTIELCKTYKNTETGLQISRTDDAVGIENWPSCNTILNCDSYDNRDSSDNNADGFAAKLTVGEGNVFRGCIAYNNADDGWDLFAKASLIGAVKVEDCIAYGNGFCTDSDGKLVRTNGDGNGFKLGGSGQPVAHEIKGSISFGNAANGFTNNSDPIFKASDCIGYNNAGQNLELHIYTGATTDKLVVDGFYSFADSHIGDMTLLSGESTGTDLSDSSVKGGNFKSARNYFWSSSQKTSVNSAGDALTADSFVSLSEYADYMNLKTKYERDANGNIVYGDFLKLKTGANTDDSDVANRFSDINGTEWFVKAVQFVCDNNIMAGTGEEFRPNDPLTREQFTQVLYNHKSKPAVSIGNPYTDVLAGSWYEKSVLWAKENDIANGKGDGIFGVGANITREELALMLYKYAALSGLDTSAEETAIDPYGDSANVSSWAKAAMNWAVTRGVMSGKGTGDDLAAYRLDPQGNATRAECASMMRKLLMN